MAPTQEPESDRKIDVLCMKYKKKNPICMVGVYVKFSRTESGISTGKRQSLWVSDLEQMFCKLHSSSADCEDGNDWH